MRAHRIWLPAILLASLLVLPVVAQDDESTVIDTDQLTEREKVIHLLNRVTFGPKPGQVDEVLEMGWEKWVEEQLYPELIPDYYCEKHLEDLGSIRLSCRELLDTYYPQVRNPSPEERKRIERLRRIPRDELMTSVVYRAIYSDCQIKEVMLDFWRNHFNITVEKDQCRYIAPAYEREVLREHVFGNFGDMLMASAKHPAMLLYLDNHLSQKPLNEAEKEAIAAQGPNRPRNSVRQRGLNENYARELLELHTLGVDNGYTQRDVWDTARVLTGWTIDRGPFTFTFRPEYHDLEKKRVLGTTIRANNSGPIEGERLIEGLAADKRTAQFISYKMCRYLVDDEPPEEMVDRIAKVFRKSEGDLREVTKAIIFDEDFFNPRFFRSKFKTPFEFTVSMLRALDCEVENIQPIFDSLRTMRQPIYHCEDPTGYYDTAEAWLDPGVLALRWQLALDMCTARKPSLRIPDDFFVPEEVTDHDEIRDALIEKVVPDARLGSTTLKVLGRIMESSQGADSRTLQLRLMGILLGCPEFQRQ